MSRSQNVITFVLMGLINHVVAPLIVFDMKTNLGLVYIVSRNFGWFWPTPNWIIFSRTHHNSVAKVFNKKNRIQKALFFGHIVILCSKIEKCIISNRYNQLYKTHNANVSFWGFNIWQPLISWLSTNSKIPFAVWIFVGPKYSSKVSCDGRA